MIHRRHQQIACQQVLLEDSSIFSVQWSLFPAEIAHDLTPLILLERYLGYLRSATCSVIRPAIAGGGIEFRLLGYQNAPLISFLPAVYEGDDLVIRICGGLLVQRQQCHRGEVRFGVEPMAGGVKVSLQLSDYCPLILGSSRPSLLRRWLYRLTQAAIHRLVTIRFLSQLYHDLSGLKVPIQVVAVQERQGRPV